METDGADQFFRLEEGKGAGGEIDGITHTLKDGSGVIVPYGEMHNVTNTSITAVLKQYTIYSPTVHMDNVVRKTKQEALQMKSIFNGRTSDLQLFFPKRCLSRSFA